MTLPAPRLDLPLPVRTYLSALLVNLNRELVERPPARVPRQSLLLASPNGSVYTVTVADDGTLSTTKVQG